MSQTLAIKAALRLQLRQSLRALTAAERAAASEQLRRVLVAQSVWKDASALLAFVPTASEPDIWECVLVALAAGWLVALPRFDPATQTYLPRVIQDPGRDLQPGPYGILEPIPGCPGLDGKRLDLILVPGLGFSPSGGRLGRGKGFYDRLLAATPGCKCGVAFDQQIVAEFPLESHDARLDLLVTPTRCWSTTTRNFDAQPVPNPEPNPNPAGP